MGWTADPRNLLLVDDTFRQPDFIGWYAASTTLLLEPDLLPNAHLLTGGRSPLLAPTPGLKANKGLRSGPSQPIPQVRIGNGNDTITLLPGESITSHRINPAGKYPTYFAVTAGQAYTLGVTCTGINASQKISTCALKILWINPAGTITESAQGIVASFGQKIRNSVTDIAPAGTVGAVILFSANLAVTLSSPTFSVGITDIRTGNPTFNGGTSAIFPDNTIFPGTGIYPSSTTLILDPTNLFYNDPSTSGYPWHDGFMNEFGDKITPDDLGVLHVPANSEARLYYEEDQQVPSDMGIDILPNYDYTFGITETPSRTSSTVTLKVYDLTGTLPIQTIIPTTVGNRLTFTFTTASSAAFLTMKIAAGNVDTAFQDPLLLQGSPNTGTPPPTGTTKIQVFFTFASDVQATLKIRNTFLSDSIAHVGRSYEFPSDSLVTIATDFFDFVSDVSGPLHVEFDLDSDNAVVVSKRYEFLADGADAVSLHVDLLSDNLHTIGQIPVTLMTDSLGKVNPDIDLVSDLLQIVGRHTPVGGLVSDGQLPTSTILLPDDSQYIPSKYLRMLSDNSEVVHYFFSFLTDLTENIDTKFVDLTTDSLVIVNKSLILNSDIEETIHASIRLISDNIGYIETIEIELPTDAAQLVQDRTDLLSDVAVRVHCEPEFLTDNTQLVSYRNKSITGVNPKRSRRVVTTRPFNSIGV